MNVRVGENLHENRSREFPSEDDAGAGWTTLMSLFNLASKPLVSSSRHSH